MTIPTIPRPVDSMQKLFSELRPVFSEIFFRKNEKCEIKSTEKIFILTSGQITLVNDGFSSRVNPPLLFGLAGCFGFLTTLHFRAGENVVAYTANTADVRAYVETNNLWEDVGRIIAFNSTIQQYVYSHMRDPYKTTQYKIAKAIEHINEMQKKNEVSLLLAKEITSLTSLSRSVVMKNLFFLKSNGFIEIDEGVLTSLDSEKLKRYCF